MQLWHLSNQSIFNWVLYRVSLHQLWIVLLKGLILRHNQTLNPQLFLLSWSQNELAIHYFSLVGSFEVECRLDARVSQHLSVLLQLQLLLKESLFGLLPFELSLEPFILLLDLEALLLLQPLLPFSLSFFSCLLLSLGLCLCLLLPSSLFCLEALQSLPLLLCDLVLSLLPLQFPLPLLIMLLLLQSTLLLFSLPLQLQKLLLPLLHSLLLEPLLLSLLLHPSPLMFCSPLPLLGLKLLFLVLHGLLLGMGPPLLGILFGPALFDDGLAARAKPFDVFSACPAVREDGRHRLVGEVVLLAISLQA